MILTRVTTVKAPLCKGAFKNMLNKELPDSLGDGWIHCRYGSVLRIE